MQHFTDNPGRDDSAYIGRFAPSPTGPVHFGTLLAAVGSYLQAKVNNGKWLLRMEDVDTTRRVDGADTDILHTLEAFGFEWHGDVVYQSQRTELYRQALDMLASDHRLFPCLCSRKQLAATGSDVYPGTCRHRTFPEKRDHAVRVIVDDSIILFDDCILGRQQQKLATECGDFVVKRRDGLFAYQLAVVVDDALQGITEIVRGADLLDSTPRQIYLQRLLGYPTPGYCHLPLAVDQNGSKISKSAGAAKVDISGRQAALVHVLDFLGQQPPRELLDTDLAAIWRWATEHWKLAKVPRKSMALGRLALS
jgi:glutamyl-Q tRNA(Asp) synthetase